LSAYIGVRARGAGGGAAAPLTRAKPFFGQKLNFSGKIQQPNTKNKHIFVFIKRKKTEFNPPSEIKTARNPGFFTNIHWVG